MPGPSSPPNPVDLLTEWRPDLLTLAVLAVLAAGYVRARRRLAAAGGSWPVGRDVAFAVGLALTAWVTSGFLEARGRQLLWVWTTQQLSLLLAVPVVLLLAQPVSLARTSGGPGSPVVRFLSSRVGRLLGHPLLGPLYVPVLCGLLYFGGLGAWAVRSTAAGWLLHVVLLGVGLLIALPLLDAEDDRSSLAVGAAVAIGVFELLIDAIPGIVVRLETHLTIAPFGVGRPSWAGTWLHDQQFAGAILWTLAEVLDLPFLLLTFRQWIRVERREAARIDAELDRAEREAAAHAPTTPDGPEPAAPASTRPWWLDHPDLRRRFGEE